MNELNSQDQKVYTLFSPIVKLVKVFKDTENKVLPPEDSRIKLNTVVSKMSLFYEKIRNAVDYEEEHLLRERAIRRNLKRTMTLPNRSGKIIAKPLVLDMVRSGYLPNNELSEDIVTKGEIIIDKYLGLIDRIGKYKEKKEKVELFEWLVNILSIELDDLFETKSKEDSLVECMYQVVSKDIVVTDSKYSESDIKIQLYIAILRSLIKADIARVGYYLWQLYVPNWREAEEIDLTDVAQKIGSIYQKIQMQIKHPLGDLYMRILRKYNVIFLIIQDIIKDEPAAAIDVWKNPALLEEKIRNATKKRYKISKVKLRRSIVRSIIYLLITKMVLAVLLELPLDWLIERELNIISIVINVLFPPALMFLIGLFIRVPSMKNTDKIVQGIKEISYQFDERQVLHKIKKQLKRSVFMTRAFRVVYTIIFTFTFGMIFYGLHNLSFNIASMVIFIFFLSLVSFFSIRISQSARELHIIEKKANVFTFFKDFFSLPILHFGRWLSNNLNKINFFVILFDFVIEAPFKVLVDIIDEWTTYVEEKKEELY